MKAGEVIDMRCVDIGKYRLEGSQRRRCVGGHFDGLETRCVGLNQMYDYKEIIIIMSHLQICLNIMAQKFFDYILL